MVIRRVPITIVLATVFYGRSTVHCIFNPERSRDGTIGTITLHHHDLISNWTLEN